MSESYDADLAKIKKSSSERLQLELVAAGQDESIVHKYSRAALITESMTLKGHLMPELESADEPRVSAGVMQFESVIAMFMQQTRDEKAEAQERARNEKDMLLRILNQQRAASEAQLGMLADSLKMQMQQQASRDEQAKIDREVDRGRRETQDTTKDVMLKRYGDLLKNT
jgi:hypothetical protein